MPKRYSALYSYELHIKQTYGTHFMGIKERKRKQARSNNRKIFRHQVFKKNEMFH